MSEMINKIGKRLVTKMRVVNKVREAGGYADNFRECPIYSEFAGMLQLLETMGIAYIVDWDEGVTWMTAITIEGKKFMV